MQEWAISENYYYYYYYYAAFNAPCVGHKDDESQAKRICQGWTVLDWTISDEIAGGGQCRSIFLCVIIPAKSRDYVFTGVGLFVCLSVCLLPR